MEEDVGGARNLRLSAASALSMSLPILGLTPTLLCSRHCFTAAALHRSGLRTFLTSDHAIAFLPGKADVLISTCSHSEVLLVDLPSTHNILSARSMLACGHCSHFAWVFIQYATASFHHFKAFSPGHEDISPPTGLASTVGAILGCPKASPGARRSLLAIPGKQSSNQKPFKMLMTSF